MPAFTSRVEFPQDIINLVLHPIANYFKIDTKCKTSTLVTRILKKATLKLKNLNDKKLQPILAALYDAIEPVESILEIISIPLRPLLKIIPPKYLIIVVAILLIPIVFLPLQMTGLLLWYLLESILVLPFRRSKYEYDHVPSVIAKDKYIIKKTAQENRTMKISEFIMLSGKDRRIWSYEIDEATNQKLSKIFDIINVFPDLDFSNIEYDENLNYDFFNSLGIDLEEKIDLKVTWFSGRTRVIPPTLHKLVAGIRNITDKFKDNVKGNEKAAELLEKMTKWFVFGFWAPVFGL